MNPCSRFSQMFSMIQCMSMGKTACCAWKLASLTPECLGGQFLSRTCHFCLGSQLFMFSIWALVVGYWLTVVVSWSVPDIATFVGDYEKPVSRIVTLALLSNHSSRKGDFFFLLPPSPVFCFVFFLISFLFGSNFFPPQVDSIRMFCFDTACIHVINLFFSVSEHFFFFMIMKFSWEEDTVVM